MASKIYGIIGHPVGHSLSPAMQNAAFRALDMDAHYKLFDVKPDDLEIFLKDVVKNGISGLNVTIPHKIKAKDYVERRGSLDENAKRLGAVNTIRVSNGILEGFNTDGAGFYRSLIEDLKFEPEGKKVFILGAGGAARALTMYLGNGPRRIYIFDVASDNSEELKIHYQKYYDAKRLEVTKYEGLKSAMEDADLLVNATPIGMKETDALPIESELLRPGLYVYDLVYNRPATELVKESRRRKAHAVTGLGMLLYQGAISFEIWTGRKAPIGAMRKALKAALESQVKDNG